MSELLEFLAGDDGVEATDLVILPVFVYTSVREAVILVTLELVHGVIHPGTVEHVQAEQQLEILLDPFCLLLTRSSMAFTSRSLVKTSPCSSTRSFDLTCCLATDTPLLRLPPILAKSMRITGRSCETRRGIKKHNPHMRLYRSGIRTLQTHYPIRLNFSLLDQGLGASRPPCVSLSACRARGLPTHLYAKCLSLAL